MISEQCAQEPSNPPPATPPTPCSRRSFIIRHSTFCIPPPAARKKKMTKRTQTSPLALSKTRFARTREPKPNPARDRTNPFGAACRESVALISNRRTQWGGLRGRRRTPIDVRPPPLDRGSDATSSSSTACQPLISLVSSCVLIAGRACENFFDRPSTVDSLARARWLLGILHQVADVPIVVRYGRTRFALGEFVQDCETGNLENVPVLSWSQKMQFVD